MKNIFIPIVILSVIVGAVLFGCKTQKQTTGTTTKPANEQNNMKENPPKWSLLREGALGSSETAQQIVIKSADEWAKMWKETNQNFEPMPPLPVVDFSKDWVIGCMMGMKSSGGYNAKIKEITVSGDVLKVTVTHTSPGKNCMSIDMITLPYSFYIVEHYKQSKTDFEVVSVSKDCN